jgi:hypothetical protein
MNFYDSRKAVLSSWFSAIQHGDATEELAWSLEL